MKNVVDCLRRCTAHGIDIVPILDEMPHHAHYDAIAAKTKGPINDSISSYSRQYLTKGPIAAETAVAVDFVRNIIETDPELLFNMLAWSLANEFFVKTSDSPFRVKEVLE